MMALAMAFVGDTVPKEKTGSALGLLGTMSAVGTALGPSLGGVLIAGLGWRAASTSRADRQTEAAPRLRQRPDGLARYSPHP